MRLRVGLMQRRPAVAPSVDEVLLLSNGADALLLTDGASFLKLASSQ